MNIQLKEPSPDDESDWIILWNEYCNNKINEEITKTTWNKLLNNSSINGLFAVIDNNIIGFIHYVIHDCTWEIKPVCYIEDLFVTKNYRGHDSIVAKTMMNHLIDKLNNHEYSRIYGITQEHNKIAQKLYSHYTIGHPYIRYILKPA
jgi:ribosomal protein S18 acetylase RimI-like enzyme